MKKLALVISMFAAGKVFALGPHEVLLLANERSTDSISIAREFSRLRSVPESNVLMLSVPADADGEWVEMSRDEFLRLIWLPATQLAAERGIDDHILAWIYSSDFPFRISTDPPISLQGATFLRGQMPVPAAITKGTFRSSLYAGPDYAGTKAHYSMTFDVYRKWQGRGMPVPSMMLGYTGRRGSDVERVIACLRRGVASDGSNPEGTVFFVVSDDVRSQCRHWQYETAKRKLESLGVKAEITTRYPADRKDVLGLLMGTAVVGEQQRYPLLPGAMTEHLTSMAAAFDNPDQTKMSVWIKRGATATCGAVTEPRANWRKFPGAWFYVQYASGCSMLESFYQAIRSPLQILLVGDPLAHPWAPAARISFTGLDMPLVTGRIEVGAVVEAEIGSYYGEFLYLLDGQVIGDDSVLQFDSTRITNGVHKLRVVAYRTGFIRSQVFAEEEIVIAN